MTALSLARPVGMTLCSGIGAPEVAAPWVDWRFASEIEPFPRAVLQHRFGYLTPDGHKHGGPLLWGDMAEVTPDLLRAHGIPLPEIVVAGTPCQDFSIAGLRAGLDGDRGNLTLTFVRLLHAIVDARPDGKLAALWENVPGVLSDKGNAFGCFLGGLVGALDAIPAPAGRSWPGEGMVEGPRARAAWAVLDAQWFGVAQRRQRVFVVVDFGGALDPAAVLLEPDRLRGDHPPRREAGKIAPTVPARSTGGGGLGTDFDCDGGLIEANSGDVGYCLTASGQNSLDAETETETETLIAVAHSLRGEGFDASEDGTGRGTPIVPVAVALRGRDGGGQIEVGDDCAFALRASSGGGDKPHVFAPVAFAPKAAGKQTNLGFRDDGVCQTLSTTQEPGIVSPFAVRRLTPRECARLQAFPDDHTRIPWRGKPPDQCPDGPQYKALGNSMCTSVVAWIMNRMRISMSAAAMQWGGHAMNQITEITA